MQINSIMAQEGLSSSDVITEITLNQTEDGQTVAVVSESSPMKQEEGEQPSHQVALSSLSSVQFNSIQFNSKA